MTKAVIVSLRIILGLIFLWAGLSKVGEPMQTLATVYSYQIVLPDGVAWAIAYSLPWVEIVVGVALIFGLVLPVTLSATAVVLFVFTILTAQAWWRELPIDCGCIDLSALHPAFAVLTTPGGATLRNLVLVGVTVLLAFLVRRDRRTTTTA
jgi:uncharacterized membrane protein YphA (DoxX/SURF4 family)